MSTFKILRLVLWAVFTLVSACVSEYCRGDGPLAYGSNGWRSAGLSPETAPLVIPKSAAGPSRLKPQASSPLAGVAVRAYGNTAGTPTAAAQWTWSDPAPWHACMVRVQCGSAAGSGVYVHVGRVRFVLTAQHVIADGGQTTCRWIDGRVDRAVLSTSDKHGHDVAAIQLEDYHPDVRPLPVARRTPEPGEWMEVCGYGGGGVRLRNYYVQVSPTPGYTDGSGLATPGPIHGDSGGGVLTADEQNILCVATVVSAGSGGSVDGLGDNHAYEQLCYPNPAAVSDFASRVAAAWVGTRPAVMSGVALATGEPERPAASAVPLTPVPAQYDETQCGPGGCPLPGRRGQPQPRNDNWFPDGEPYRLGPRRGGGDIDIEINGRERDGYEEPDDNSGVELLIGLAAMALVGLGALAFNFKQRI